MYVAFLPKINFYHWLIDKVFDFEWLLPHSTHTGQHEVLQVAGHESHQNQTPDDSGSSAVCVPPQLFHRGHNLSYSSPGTNPPQQENTNVGMLFTDISSDFNTIIPQQLIDNLDLHLLTGRPQSGWISPGLCAQPTAVYTANPRLHCHIQFKPHSNSLMRLTAVSHSTSYKEEVEQFTGWCKNSSRSLNIDQTKEMTADSPLSIKYINY